jgi:hypothetical protein
MHIDKEMPIAFHLLDNQKARPILHIAIAMKTMA